MSCENIGSGMQVVFGEFASFANSNVCLYSHFDYENIVDEYVYYSLEEAKKSGFEIIFITTCSQLAETDVDRLKRICHAVVMRENIGLDFGGWAEIINGYPSILSADNLTITNDSVYWPLGDLSTFMSEMSDQGYDFWGAAECYQIKPHIQSYYINFTAKVLQSPVFQSFWLNYRHIKDKKKLIVGCEVSITQMLHKAGFSYGSGFGKSGVFGSFDGIYAINPSHHLWEEMVCKYHIPFVKVELLRDNPFAIDLDSVKQIVVDTGYDYNLILKHINRVKKYYTKADIPSEVNEGITNAAVGVKKFIANDGVEHQPVKHVASRHSRKAAILWYILKFPFVSPHDAVFVFRHALIAGIRCLKHELLKSYYQVKLIDEGLSSATIYEFRQNRKLDYKDGMPEADSFAMRQVKVKNRCAVVCHIYYKELYHEMLDVIKKIPSADIYISLVEGSSQDLLETIKIDLPGSYVQIFRNHGRDVYPFMKFVQSGVLYNYDAVLKIHSKVSQNDKSSYDFDGESWRKDILRELVPDDGVDELVNKFLSSTSAGIISHKNYIYGEEHIGSNEANLHMLCNSLGLEFRRDELKFPAGTMFWIKPWLLRHIDALDLNANDFDVEPIAVDGTMAHALERFIGVMTIKAGYEILSAADMVDSNNKPKSGEVDVLAFYLPQFHPIKENDIWWGKGFTEWRNVSKARPVFKTHYQPRIPEELGYYDLRMNEVQERQAEMASNCGLSAFVFYQYWFSGKKLLNSPIDDFMDNKKIDFKFLLCWANENWTRNWDGLKSDILLEQEYEEGWEVKYANDVAIYLKSSCYYKRDGRPVLLIYNVSAIPDCKQCMANMREALTANGVGDVEIIAVWFYGVTYDADYYGVDGFSEFPPHRLDFIGSRNEIITGLDDGFEGAIYNYEAVANSKIEKIKSNECLDMSMGVMCGWDNTARRQYTSDIFHGSTPAVFRKWLSVAYQSSLDRSTTQNKQMLFINAWNEWAEGTYLEPDIKYGAAYLEAVRSVIKNESS